MWPEIKDSQWPIFAKAFTENAQVQVFFGGGVAPTFWILLFFTKFEISLFRESELVPIACCLFFHHNPSRQAPLRPKFFIKAHISFQHSEFKNQEWRRQLYNRKTEMKPSLHLLSFIYIQLNSAYYLSFCFLFGQSIIKIQEASPFFFSILSRTWSSLTSLFLSWSNQNGSSVRLWPGTPNVESSIETIVRIQIPADYCVVNVKLALLCGVETLSWLVAFIFVAQQFI